MKATEIQSNVGIVSKFDIQNFHLYLFDKGHKNVSIVKGFKCMLRQMTQYTIAKS